jgi:glycosyltransferase involved in cell wall biosynthesis
MASSISVVIPTYNGSAFIRDALDSVFAQTRPPQEIIVVDDASTDGTLDIAADKARGAPVRMHLIRLVKNSGGPARPINVGVGRARAEFIAILDQDDLFLPHKLAVQADFLTSNPDIMFVFGLGGHLKQPSKMSQDQVVIEQLMGLCNRRRDLWIVPSLAGIALLVDKAFFVLGHPGYLFRKKDWCRKGGLDERLRICSDLEFVMWLFTQGMAGLVPDIHYLRRVHGDNLSQSHHLMWREINQINVTYLPWVTSALLDRMEPVDVCRKLHGMGCWVRNGGDYIGAMRIHLAGLRIGFFCRQHLMSLVKLFPHYLLRQLMEPTFII